MPDQATLFRHVLGFMDALRAAGLPADPAGAVDLCAGLRHIDISRPSDFQATARATLIHRQEDLARFDEVFREYWLGQRRPRNRLGDHDDSEVQGPEPKPAPHDEPGDETGPERDEQQASYSAEEILDRWDIPGVQARLRGGLRFHYLLERSTGFLDAGNSNIVGAPVIRRITA